MELLKGSMATCCSPAGHLCLYDVIEKYGLLVQGLCPLPSITLRRGARTPKEMQAHLWSFLGAETRGLETWRWVGLGHGTMNTRKDIMFIGWKQTFEELIFFQLIPRSRLRRLIKTSCGRSTILRL